MPHSCNISIMGQLRTLLFMVLSPGPRMMEHSLITLLWQKQRIGLAKKF